MMEQDRDRNIKNLLKEAGLEQTSDEFSGSVMKKVYEHETARENAMYTLLQRSGSEVAPDGLMDKVMSRLPKSARKVAYKPIIGKYGWIGIATVFAAMVIFALTAGGAEAPSDSLSAVSDKINKGISSFTDTLSVGPILAITALALFALAILDRISSLRTRD